MDEKIQMVFNRLANEEYIKLTMKRKKELFDSFSIDCGTDYARYILQELVYDKDGASIY